MINCPVCNYSNSPEEIYCQRCSWSLTEIPKHLGLNLDKKELKNWIERLIDRDNDRINKSDRFLGNNDRSIDNQNLIRRLNKIENKQEGDIKSLNKKIDKLKERVTELENKNNGRDNVKTIDLDPLGDNDNKNIPEGSLYNETIDRDLLDDIGNKKDTQLEGNYKDEVPLGDNNNKNIPEGSFYNETIDRDPLEDIGNKRNPEKQVDYNNGDSFKDKESNNIREGSLYNETIDRDPLEDIENKKYPQEKTNDGNSDPSWYDLIRKNKGEYPKVEVPKDTLEKIRSGTINKIQFSTTPRGDYYIIDRDNLYYLIPKENIKLNQFKYKTFQKVFDCQDYQESFSNFQLDKPATVIKSGGTVWQLEAKGKIKFII